MMMTAKSKCIFTYAFKNLLNKRKIHQVIPMIIIFINPISIKVEDFLSIYFK